MLKLNKSLTAEKYLLELFKAETEIKWYLKTSEDYKYLKNVIKENKKALKELFTIMTWNETQKVAKGVLNRKIEAQKNIINGYETTNSQRIKALNKYFELSEVARSDQYVNYLDKTILDY